MRGTLILTVLAGEGDNHTPDTLQWWIGSSDAWRIRTFANVRGIHTYRVEAAVPSDLVARAKENDRKYYGENMGREYTLHFADCTDRGEVATRLAEAGLAPHLELADGFAFWKPESAPYGVIPV